MVTARIEKIKGVVNLKTNVDGNIADITGP
jgi:hypothetical protein